jgi:hypothetical protein
MKIGITLVAIAGIATLAGCAHRQTPAGADSADVPRWRVHTLDRPAPPTVRPLPSPVLTPAPPGAVVLFDGTDLSQWATPTGGPAQWRVGNGYFEVAPGTGTIQTRVGFGDVHLHVEWATPDPPRDTGQNRANSGIFLMGRYEVQVLDSYEAETYPDGQAAAIYGQHPPRFNASLPPGEWQSYDIYFRRPRFGADGVLLEPARVTVLHNGVLVQNNEEIRGPTEWLRYTEYAPHPEALPIGLQDHGSPVRFRNIWARRIPEVAPPPPSHARTEAPVALSRQQLDRFTGRYDRPGADAPIIVTREGDRLFADFFWRPGPLELVPVGANQFVLTETDARVTFELDEAGRPATLVFRLAGEDTRAPRAR